MFTAGKHDWIEQQVERAREKLAPRGRPLTPMGDGIAAAVAAWDPRVEPRSRERMAQASEAISREGRWVDFAEISLSLPMRGEIALKAGEDPAYADKGPVYSVSQSYGSTVLYGEIGGLGAAFALFFVYAELIMNMNEVLWAMRDDGPLYGK